MHDFPASNYPLLICDAWEHAYYLKYLNRGAKYAKNFFDLIHWPEVKKRYKMAKGQSKGALYKHKGFVTKV